MKPSAGRARHCRQAARQRLPSFIEIEYAAIRKPHLRQGRVQIHVVWRVRIARQPHQRLDKPAHAGPQGASEGSERPSGIAKRALSDPIQGLGELRPVEQVQRREGQQGGGADGQRMQRFTPQHLSRGNLGGAAGETDAEVIESAAKSPLAVKSVGSLVEQEAVLGTRPRPTAKATGSFHQHRIKAGARRFAGGHQTRDAAANHHRLTGFQWETPLNSDNLCPL